MVNKNKAKGDKHEKWATDFARSKGFDARRTKAGYERDYGDVHLFPFELHGTIIQVKAVVQYNWNDWLEGLDLQKAEAKADYGFVLNKRPGQGEAKIGEWLAVMRYEDMLDLMSELRRLRYGVSPAVEVEELKNVVD